MQIHVMIYYNNDVFIYLFIFSVWEIIMLFLKGK